MKEKKEWNIIDFYKQINNVPVCLVLCAHKYGYDILISCF